MPPRDREVRADAVARAGERQRVSRADRTVSTSASAGRPGGAAGPPRSPQHSGAVEAQHGADQRDFERRRAVGVADQAVGGRSANVSIAPDTGTPYRWHADAPEILNGGQQPAVEHVDGRTAAALPTGHRAGSARATSRAMASYSAGRHRHEADMVPGLEQRRRRPARRRRGATGVRPMSRHPPGLSVG